VKFTHENWYAELSTDSITELTAKDVPVVSGIINPAPVIKPPGVSYCSVTALGLPSSSSWPAFRDAKQVRATGRHVVIVKKSPLVVEYDNGNTSIADILLGGLQVALVGHP
jgi:hypothetical protein